MPIIPFAEWLPDLPEAAGNSARATRNVVARTGGSYAAVPTPLPFSQAAPERVRGHFSLLAADGNTYTFAATRTALLRLNDDGTWQDVTAAAGPYNTPNDILWDATAFGERVVFTQISDLPQSFYCGTDTDFAPHPAGTPKAFFCATIKDFLFLGWTWDAVDGYRPRRLWWSSIGDPLDFPDPYSDLAVMRQSSFQDLEQSDLGHLRRIVGGNLSGADGGALCERGIWRIAYVGSPAIFDFQVAEGSPGCIASWSVVTGRMASAGGMRSVAYYLAADGFYAFDGAVSIPIGAGKFDRSVLVDMLPLRASWTIGASDPTSKIIVWAYIGQGGTDLYNRALIWNWEAQRGTLVELAPVERVDRALAQGLTLEELDPLGTVDTLPASLDSRLFVAGAPQLALYDTAHRLNYLTGPNMAATVETGELGLPGRRGKLHGIVRPIIEGNSARARVSVGHREQYGAPVQYDAQVPVNALGGCGLRSSGRYLRLRLTLPPAQQFEHLVGIEAELKPDGRLR